MNLQYAQLIADQNPELEVSESYSGRGMYGRQTASVSGDRDDLVYAAQEALDDLLFDAEDVAEARAMTAEFVREVFCGSRDSMGLGEVWY